MILLITSFVFIVNSILYKKEKYEFLYIPMVIESILLFIFSFFPDFNIINLSWMTSSTWTLIITSIISAIAAVITYVKKEKSIIWYYHLVLLLLIMINNKYILSITVCICLLTELSGRIRSINKPIKTKFIIAMPLLLSLTSFFDNLNEFNTYSFSIISIFFLLIDFYKITVYRIFALLSLANLLYILGLNQSLYLPIIAIGPIYLLLKLYIIFGEERFDYRKIKPIERIIKKFIIKRNTKERILIAQNQPLKKIYNINKRSQGVTFENDIRQNFLLIIASFCTVALYLLVRS